VRCRSENIRAKTECEAVEVDTGIFEEFQA